MPNTIMKVTEFELKNNIENFPVKGSISDDNKFAPIGYSFKNFLSPEKIKKQKKKRSNITAGNTYNINRIDVDDMDIFKVLFDQDLFTNLPYYLSRNKRFPHYYVKLINMGNEKRLNIPIDYEGTRVCDILNGQAAWYKTNEKMVKVNEIPELDFNIFKNHITNRKEKEKKKTKKEVLANHMHEYEANQGNIDEEVTNILNCLSEERFSYEQWLKVGMILYNTNSDRLFDNWVEWSKKSNDFNLDELMKKWNSFKIHTNKVTMGTLRYMAEQDNPDKYNEIMLNKLIIKSLWSQTDVKIAKVIHHVLKNKIKTTLSIDGSASWYIYKDGIWARSTIVHIDGLLHEFVEPAYINFIMKYQKRKDDKYLDEFNMFSAEVIAKLGSSRRSKEILNKTKILFNDDDFKENMNHNNYLVCFGENSYDLHKCEWRKTLSSDYCTISTRYDKSEVTDEYEEEVEAILKDIFIDESKYEYMMNCIALMLRGENKNEQFCIWTGHGGNGKGVLSNLLDFVFGQYFSSPPTSLITGSAPDANQPCPALFAMQFARVCIFAEPEKNKKLNNSFIKQLTGGDTISTRQLYGEQIEFVPRFTPILQANVFNAEDCEDDSFKRRVVFCKFSTKFTSDPTLKFHRKINTNLKQRKFKERIRGSFMNILIKRWQKLHNNDFKNDMPKTMLENRQEFIEDSDIVKTFLNDNVEQTDDKQNCILLSDLYEDFKQAMKEQGEGKCPTRKQFRNRCMKYLPNFKERKKIGKIVKRNVFTHCKSIDDSSNTTIHPLDVR
jgi:P4 family phage/plasmid primase-like protien